MNKGEILMKKVYFLHGFMGTAETHFTDQIAYFEDKHAVGYTGAWNAPVEASILRKLLITLLLKWRIKGKDL